MIIFLFDDIILHERTPFLKIFLLPSEGTLFVLQTQLLVISQGLEGQSPLKEQEGRVAFRKNETLPLTSNSR